MKVDSVAVLTESIIVRYFKEDLKPSIKDEMDQNATHLDNYEEQIVKVVRVKAKVGL